MAVQADGVQHEAHADCTGLEVTSAFTANVWEVWHPHPSPAHLHELSSNIICEQNPQDMVMHPHQSSCFKAERWRTCCRVHKIKLWVHPRCLRACRNFGNDTHVLAVHR